MNAVGRDVARLARVFPGETASLDAARTAVADFLRDHGTSDQVVELARLIVSELASNAVQFAPANDYSVVVEVDTTAGAGAIGVRSAGSASLISGRDLDELDSPGDLALRGRGLGIVRTVSDGFHVVDDGDGTVTVTATIMLS